MSGDKKKIVFIDLEEEEEKKDKFEELFEIIDLEEDKDQ